MEDTDFYKIFFPLWNDINDKESFPKKRPLLAHYTSIESLESILSNDEIWFSNPLYMNDIEELKFGMLVGANTFRQSNQLKSACKSDTRHKLLLDSFNYYFNEFDYKHAFDTYVFCLSEHDKDDSDGLLSMWRGYGGNGKGAAILFNLEKANYVENSPIIISSVEYATTDQRHKWIEEKILQFSNLLAESNIPDGKLYLPAHYFFERLKLFSLFTKHKGFSEEREWRVVYMIERDINNKIGKMFHYEIGENGIEPKLKLKISPIDGIIGEDVSLENLISKIILGPTLSTPLAITAVQRMLDKIGKSSLTDKLIASTIPFRPI